MTDDSPETVLALHVQPGAAREAWRYDAWRKRWTLSLRARPLKGEANRDALGAIARALGVAPESISWRRAGSSRDKVAVISGLGPLEVEHRLRRASRPVDR